ncbi:MAG: FAD-dependent oxidoreductase, partial [Candidatus Acidiferrales bacterium]
MSAKIYDVAIVGAGIIGGAIAWELARAGLRVALLDRQQAGMEASWAAAG